MIALCAVLNLIVLGYIAYVTWYNRRMVKLHREIAEKNQREVIELEKQRIEEIKRWERGEAAQGVSSFFAYADSVEAVHEENDGSVYFDRVAGVILVQGLAGVVISIRCENGATIRFKAEKVFLSRRDGQ
jgi:hypothetical protein